MMKGIAIILVIVGHMNIPIYISKIIYSFHMPLFFILAGYFFRPKSGVVESVKKDVQRLLIPYFVVVLFLAIYGCFVHGVIEYNFATYLASGNLLIIIYPDGINWMGKQTPTLAVWFLFALFWCKFFFRILYEYLDGFAFHVCIIFISLIGYLLNNILPFCISQGCIACLFYNIGYLIATKRLPFSHLWFKTTIVVIWLLCIFWGQIDMVRGIYRLYALEFIGALGGTFIVYALSDKIQSIPYLSTFMQWIGINSLIVLCVHTIERYVPIWPILHVNSFWDCWFVKWG